MGREAKRDEGSTTGQQQTQEVQCPMHWAHSASQILYSLKMKVGEKIPHVTKIQRVNDYTSGARIINTFMSAADQMVHRQFVYPLMLWEECSKGEQNTLCCLCRLIQMLAENCKLFVNLVNSFRGATQRISDTRALTP